MPVTTLASARWRDTQKGSVVPAPTDHELRVVAERLGFYSNPNGRCGEVGPRAERGA